MRHSVVLGVQIDVGVGLCVIICIYFGKDLGAVVGLGRHGV